MTMNPTMSNMNVMTNQNIMTNVTPTNQSIPTQDFLIQNDMYMENNFSAFFTFDYMQALKHAKSAFVKQKVELFEVISGCETKNRYKVFLKFENGNNALIFKCKEESTCCSRHCIA